MAQVVQMLDETGKVCSEDGVVAVSNLKDLLGLYNVSVIRDNSSSPKDKCSAVCYTATTQSTVKSTITYAHS
jgi:hypothetical protein